MAQTIVLIEDEHDVAEVLQEVLEMEGYEVLAFREPEPVSKQVARSEPALFLIDIMLPGKSGIELAQELRQQGFGNTCMIAMSASHRMTSEARQSGLFTHTLDKPFDVQTLLDTVEECLDEDVAGSGYTVRVKAHWLNREPLRSIG